MSLPSSELLFTFGLIADVQYADVDDEETKRYRAAVEHLATAVHEFNATRPSFVVNLGDIIEGRAPEAEWARVQAELTQLEVPLRHVIGNHCLRLPRARLHQCLGLGDQPFYAFSVADVDFLVLDSQDLSLRGTDVGSVARQLSDELLARVRLAGAANGVDWNGGLGDAQLQWLDEQLRTSAAAGRRAIVFAHIPMLRAATSERHLLWNHDAVLDVLRRHRPEAVFCGHYHAGGYGEADGVHHVTLDGVLEAPASARACHAYVDVYADRLELRGAAGSAIAPRTLQRRAHDN